MAGVRGAKATRAKVVRAGSPVRPNIRARLAVARNPIKFLRLRGVRGIPFAMKAMVLSGPGLPQSIKIDKPKVRRLFTPQTEAAKQQGLK